jgi:MFS superfamily sulfate permease-like transporter
MIGERRKEKPEQEKKHLTYQLEKQLFFVNLRFLSQKLILSVQKKNMHNETSEHGLLY